MSFEIRTLCLSVPSVVEASVCPSSDAVLESCDVEIHQQADLLATELQIRDELRLEQRNHFLHGFQFDDDCIFNENVDSVAYNQFHLIVNHGQADLTQRLKPAFTKLINQTRFISRLQQSRSKPTVDFDGGGDDFRSERVIGFSSVRIHDDFSSTTEPKPRATEIFKP